MYFVLLCRQTEIEQEIVIRDSVENFRVFHVCFLVLEEFVQLFRILNRNLQKSKIYNLNYIKKIISKTNLNRNIFKWNVFRIKNET